MIAAAKSTRTLYGEEVWDSLDDADLSQLPFLVPTNRAFFILGKVAANGTSSGRGSRCSKNLNESVETFGFLHQQVKCNTFGRPVT
jgi:hypothetical protein